MQLKAKTYLVAALILTFLCSSFTHAAPPAETLHLTLKDLGSNDLSLTGLYGAASTWIPFQSNWVFEEEIKMTVVYTASPLLHRQRSTLTILANDQEVTSIHPIADGAKHTLSFTIPLELLQGQGFSLRFQGYLRLTDLPCEETNNPAQWLKILSNTSLEITPSLNQQPPDLSDLPQAIALQNTPADPPPVIFVLPDNPDPTTLTTAAQVAARLGQATGNRPLPFEAATPTTLTETQRQQANLVVVGLPTNQPLIGQMAALLPAPLSPGSPLITTNSPLTTNNSPLTTTPSSGFLTTDNFIAPPEHGVIQIFNSPWNESGKVLLVSAGQTEGLWLAGQAFADHLTFQSLRGSFRFIRALEMALEPLPGPAWSTPKTTLAQLGQGTRTVRGTGLFHEYYYLRRPPGWVLDHGSQLSLHLAFSPALQANESYVAAFINEVHVGTIRIGQGIEETQATFDLPIALLNETPQGGRPQELTLHLVVANFLQEKICDQTQPEAAWTQILPDSYFVTPHVYLALPDLQAFPYPFVSDNADSPSSGRSQTAPVAIIVPPTPQPAELGLALSLAATLGRFAPADFELELLPADQVSAATHAGAHLIVLGERTRQPLLTEFLETTAGLPGYRGQESLYQALRGSSSGLLREAPSPWNKERIALLVFGDSKAGFENAVQALFKAAPPVGQPGSAAVVEADQPPRIIYRSIEAAPGLEPGEVLREPLFPQPQPWLVITIILVVATLAVLGLLWFSRHHAARSRSD
jgi:hypothetical protein